MEEIQIGEKARAELLENIPQSIEGNERGSAIADTPGGVFCLVASAAPRDSRDEDVKNELEAARLEMNRLAARRNLMVYLAGSGADRTRYRHDDALGEAISSQYADIAANGIQSAAGVEGEWAFALVWAAPGVSIALRGAPLASGRLRDDYCSFLYDRAKKEFDAGRYAGALPIFKHIHDLKWANINLYLDASECFLRTNDAREAGKLLDELVKTLGDDMGSDDLARAGRLFRETGDRKSALGAFKLARERYNEGK
ncbi:MAG: tetratricopeptide repeat protein [Synergistaceae bacterium]|nr:tetratricopeptide repeat protein [Synergistaceae bacterium]